MKYLNIIFILLDKKEKTFSYILFLLALIAVLFETLSIGLIIPITSFVLKDDYELIQNINFFETYSKNEKLFYAILLFFIIIIIKNIYLALVSFIQQKYTWGVYKNLSNKFFKLYLNLDYKNYVSLNSSEIIKNISVQLNLITTYLNSLLYLIIEIFIIVGVCIILFLFDYLSTTIIFLSYGLVMIFYIFFIKNIMNKSGTNKKKYDYKILDNLNNTFGAYKFIILQNLQKYFFNNHNIYVNKIASAGFNQGFISSIPKYLIETITIFIVLCIIYYLKNDYFIEDVIQLLALFVAAAFKLIPSINRIMVSVSHLQASYPIINNLIEQREKFKNENEKKFITNLNINNSFFFENDIRFNCVSFSHGKNQIFKNLNLTIKKNSFIGIMGDSGVGKTTLIDLLMGFISPDIGNIYVDKKDIKFNLKNWQKKIGYVSQSVYLKDGTLLENIAYGVNEKDVETKLIDLSLAKSSLSKEETKKMYNKIGEKGAMISGGQAQRIGIARALYLNCDILILDEPTSSLDKTREAEILNSIAGLKSYKTIILISHKKENLINCDNVYKIKNKNIELFKI